MKVLFLSKLLFFKEDNSLQQENLEFIDQLIAKGIKPVIVAGKNTIDIIKPLLPQKYKDNLGFANRSSEIRQYIKRNRSRDNLFGMIGVVDDDAIFAFNSKIPIFNCKNIFTINVGPKVEQYGLQILNVNEILACFDSYFIHEKNYFDIEIDDKYRVVSVNNANTYYM